MVNFVTQKWYAHGIHIWKSYDYNLIATDIVVYEKAKLKVISTSFVLAR